MSQKPEPLKEERQFISAGTTLRNDKADSLNTQILETEHIAIAIVQRAFGDVS